MLNRQETTQSLPPKDFLFKDYDMKVGYLTAHLGRMWTRFNYFVSVESALVGGKFIFGDGKLSTQLAVVGAALWRCSAPGSVCCLCSRRDRD